jgi:hypothetical protein
LDHQGRYRNGKNYLEIDGPKWRFVGSVSSDDEVVQWPINDNIPGDVSSGFLICVPMSRIAPAGRSLGSLGAAIGNIGNGVRETLEMIYISGSGVSVNQISTPDGRRVFDPATRDYELNDETRIDRLVRYFVAMDRSASSTPMQMFVADLACRGRLPCSL